MVKTERIFLKLNRKKKRKLKEQIYNGKIGLRQYIRTYRIKNCRRTTLGNDVNFRRRTKLLKNCQAIDNSDFDNDERHIFNLIEFILLFCTHAQAIGHYLYYENSLKRHIYRIGPPPFVSS